MNMKIKEFLRAALRQPSTWRGLVWIGAGALGMTLSDSDTNVLASAAMIVAGALGAIPLDRGRQDLNANQTAPVEPVGQVCLTEQQTDQDRQNA